MPDPDAPGDDLDRALSRWGQQFRASVPAPAPLPHLPLARHPRPTRRRHLLMGSGLVATAATAVLVATLVTSPGDSSSLVGPAATTPTPAGDPPSPLVSATDSGAPTPTPTQTVPSAALPSPTSPSSPAPAPRSTTPAPTRTRITYAAAPLQAYTAGGTLVAHVYRFVLDNGATCSIYVNQSPVGDGVAYPYGCSDGTATTPPVQSATGWTVTLRTDAYPDATGPVRRARVAHAFCVPTSCRDHWTTS